MTKRSNGRSWYQRKRWIIPSLLFFPPLGILLLWKSHWPHAGKISGSMLSGLILLSALSGDPNQSQTGATAIQPSASQTTKASTDLEATSEVISAEPPLAFDRAFSSATTATELLSTAESADDWKRVADNWNAAMAALSEIPNNSDYSTQANTKTEEYSRNYTYALEQIEAIEQIEAARIAEAAARQRQLEEQSIQAVIEEPSQGGYVSGTCKDLRSRGVGSNFTPGDPNYTARRDRDQDGIACES